MRGLRKNKILCKKLLTIVVVMTSIRICSQIPLPGVNTEYMKALLNRDGLGFFNMLTGSSFSKMSIFALSISPYITASIILQLLGIAIPSIGEWKKDGKTGQEKMEHWNVIIALAIAAVQALFISIGLGKQGLLVQYTWWMVLYTTVVWTAGSGILIFIGNKITKLNLGSGISYILLFNILSTFPQDIFSLYEVFIHGKSTASQAVAISLILVAFAVIIATCIVIHLSERKIPLMFSGKLSGVVPKKDMPIPLNACGVMPIIISGTIMSIPILISSFLPQVAWLSKVSMVLNERNWFVPEEFKYSLGVVIYVFLTLFFAFFYLEITLNSYEISSNLKQQGGTIPGIRPGKPTQEYLQKVIREVGMFGAGVVLCLILGMLLICNASGVGTLSIGGTSILICVSVILDSVKAIKTENQSSNPHAYNRIIF